MYSARITRLNPTAFIFLIDRSGSMEEKTTFGNELITKAEAVAMITNMLIRELINRCRKEDGIMDYFEIAAIGYSGEKASMLLGSGESFIKPSTLAQAKVRKKVISRELVLPNGTSVINNSEIKSVINQTQELSLAQCTVGIEYSESLERVEKILKAETK